MKCTCELVVNLTKLLVIAFAMASLQACAGATAGATINNPFHRAEPIAVPSPPVAAPYDGHVRHIGSWLDARRETVGFTNLITIRIDCDDPTALDAAHALANGDTRDIVLFSSQLGWGNEGYEERADAAQCWQRERNFIAAYRTRIVAIWIVDEPWDTAWSYQPDGVYRPNRYNAAITSICARVHADEPQLPCALNVGSLPDNLAIPDGVTLVGIEAYGNDWQTKLLVIERLTSAPIWLMPRAFTDGGDATDAEATARLRDQYAYAQIDPRITGLYWFLWCCDDEVTGDRSFFTVSGPQLPLTRAAFEALGRTIVGGAQ
jgi:hypothetical protein